jgi:hypothetical protein
MIDTLVLLAIIVLGCLALNIVILIITMQLMVRIEDLVPEMIVSPSMQVMEGSSSTDYLAVTTTSTIISIISIMKPASCVYIDMRK